jgi:GTPase
MIEWQEEKERAELAHLVGAYEKKDEERRSRAQLDELWRLCETLSLNVASESFIKIHDTTSAYYLGTGKAQEIVDEAKAEGASIIVFDCELSPMQQRNWEKLSGLKVIDRQELILNIFKSRAQTKEAELQVELARLVYSLPRLSHAYVDLNRQKGGRYGTKGSGEKKLELDKREVMDRIRDLRDAIAEVAKTRNVQRQRQERVEKRKVSLVGYTNAGKSSLLNALTMAESLVEDKLFATLDPMTKRLRLPSGGEALLTDTVGFISNLPHSLIDAFRSTLEEATRCDVLLHVLDASDPDVASQYSTTRKVLNEIGGDDKDVIIVLNKSDLAEESGAMRFLLGVYPGAIAVSAKTGQGIDELLLAIQDRLSKEDSALSYILPADRQDMVPYAYQNGEVLSVEYLDDGSVRLRARLGERHAAYYAPYLEP